MYLVFTPMAGAFSPLRLYLWWSYVPCIYSHARCIFSFEAVLLVELCTLYLLPCQVHFLLWGCTSGGVMYLVFTGMLGAFSALRLYLWWSYVPCIYTHARCIFYFEVVPLVELCTLHLLACQVHFLLWGCTSGGVMYLVFTPMPGAFSTLRLYLWWSYVPCVYLHAGWELLYASQVFIVVFVWHCSSTNQPLFVDSVFYWA